ncbi:O-succinylhomoserine sulfhydrylase [Nymphon striatum]|nr:O-succinylhomoserine sulfhydrylase [Nymphon striatum]
MIDEFEFTTLAIRAGHERTNFQENSEAIFPTSSFVFKSAEEAAARFGGQEEGHFYSRISNPTISCFQDRLAALEGGESCVATSSGMSAILAVMLGLLKAGDHVVSSRSIFGTSTLLFSNYLEKFGIEFDFVELSNLEAWDKAIRPNTKLLFAETPSNPLTELVDIKALSEIAHKKDCLLVIDNCFCTPALQKPLELGADIVVHSATKYLDGQGRCLGGAVVGDKKLVGEDVFGVLRNGGMSMSPFNAWVFTKGLETLKIRMKAHCDNALLLAEWLQQQPKVEKVYYPGLADHPQYKLAQKQQSGFGGIVSFVVKGGKENAWKVINNTRLLSITANLGDTKSTITHSATTTHGRLSQQQRDDAGISDGLLRVSAALNAVSGKTVVANELSKGTYPDKFHIVAIGKAADAMVQGVPSERIISGLVISKYGHFSTELKQAAQQHNLSLTFIESDHPIPKQSSLRAGESLLKYLKQLPMKEPCLFLISGGTSALAEVLEDGWGLSDLESLNDYLLANAYSIDEINTVRRRLSKIKGGGLWNYVGKRPVYCLMISDVPNDDPVVIGSGLLFPPQNELSSLPNLQSRLPHKWSELLTSERIQSEIPEGFEWKIIASLTEAKNAAAIKAKELGYQVNTIPEFISGNAEDVAKVCVNTMQANQESLFIWGGETTVSLPVNAGLGGRNQHLALAAAIEMSDCENTVLLAAGTDGSDGKSSATGAIVDGLTLTRGNKLGLNASDFLKQADSNSFFQKTDELIITGATGTNVMDLVIGISRSVK